jgi:hypothetical protein
VENRSPLNTEILLRIRLGTRIVSGQGKEGLCNRARVERVRHNLTLFLIYAAIKDR